MTANTEPACSGRYLAGLPDCEFCVVPADGALVTFWRLGGLGAGAFLRHALILPLRPGTTELEVHEVRDEQLQQDYQQVQETLRPPPGADVHFTLLLRVYSGDNTRATDMTARCIHASRCSSSTKWMER